MMYNTEWYVVPGFSWYDININTKEIRSHKHYKSDAFHIMKNNNGRVRIVDDYGQSRSMKVKYLYDLTFNSSKELQPASENVSRAGGMFKVNRNMDSNVDILNGGYIPIEQPKLPEAVLPDFGIKIKPFTVGI